MKRLLFTKLLVSFIILIFLCDRKNFAEENGFEGPMEMWDNKGNYFMIDEDGSYYYKDKKGNVQIRDEDGNIYVKDKNGYSYNYDYDDSGYMEFSDIWFGMHSVGSVSGGPGVVQTDGWKMIDYDKWVYIENGQCLTNTWKQYNGNWYYLGSNGEMVTGWQNINGNIYYFNSSGAMATGEQLIDRKFREFDTNGVLIK